MQINGIMINIAAIFGFAIVSQIIEKIPRNSLHYIHNFGIISCGICLFSLNIFALNTNYSIRLIKSFISSKLF